MIPDTDTDTDIDITEQAAATDTTSVAALTAATVLRCEIRDATDALVIAGADSNADKLARARALYTKQNQKPKWYPNKK